MLKSRLQTMMTTGAAAIMSQLLVLGSMPIASRLFSEESFGILGLVIALSNILSLAAHLGYADTIIAAETDEEADDLIRLIAVLGFAGAAVIALLAWGAIAFDILGYGKLPLWSIPLIVVQAVAIAFGLAFQLRIIRAERFGVMAGAHLVLGSVRATSQVLAGLIAAIAPTLVASEVASRAASAGFLIWRSGGEIFQVFERRRIIAVARTFAGFATMRSGAIFLNTFNVGMPIMIVSQYFTLAQVGAASFALTVIYAPIGLVQKALGDVFTGSYRKLLTEDQDKAWLFLVQMAGLLTVMGAAVAGVLYLFGPSLFMIIFGVQWGDAGHTAALLAPMIGLMTLIVPLSTSLNIFRRPDVNLFFNIARAIGLAAIMVTVPIFQFSYFETITLISGVSCVLYLLYGIWIYRINATPPPIGMVR